MFSWLWSCLVVPTAVVAKTWIECEFVAKALNLSMRLLRKDALSMKLLRKPEYSINICCESLYVINVAFGYEKNNPARRAGIKIILLRFWPKKNSRPGQKFQASPEYQMDCALWGIGTLHSPHTTQKISDRKQVVCRVQWLWRDFCQWAFFWNFQWAIS